MMVLYRVAKNVQSQLILDSRSDVLASEIDKPI